MKTTCIILFTLFPFQLLSQHTIQTRAIDIANAKEECAERIFNLYTEIRPKFNQLVESARKKDSVNFKNLNVLFVERTDLLSNLLRQYYVYCDQPDSVILPDIILTSSEVKRYWSDKLSIESTDELIYVTEEIYNLSLRLDRNQNKRLETIEILKNMGFLFLKCDKKLKIKTD